MALTTQAQEGLNAKIEPRERGTKTPTGLEKLSNGVLIARHSTETGEREEEEDDDDISSSSAMLEELEQLREAKPAKKTTKKKKAAAPEQPQFVNVRINVEGVGEIGAMYTHVRIGRGCAVLGLGPMSFIPKVCDMSSGVPTNVMTISTAPDRKYVYLGNTFPDANNITSLLLVEIQGGDKK